MLTVDTRTLQYAPSHERANLPQWGCTKAAAHWLALGDGNLTQQTAGLESKLGFGGAVAGGLGGHRLEPFLHLAG